jgi:hypothetical protein
MPFVAVMLAFSYPDKWNSRTGIKAVARGNGPLRTCQTAAVKYQFIGSYFELVGGQDLFIRAPVIIGDKGFEMRARLAINLEKFDF